MRHRILPALFVIILCVFVALGVVFARKNTVRESAVQPALPIATPSVVALTSPTPSPSTTVAPTPNPSPDLSVDPSGLSNATVVITTTQGVIKFKFYPQDAPNTIQRLIVLMNQGFYNGLVFHRVVPGFVIQTGDPLGNGTGGSGQKLKAEFNNRRHIEGTVAMARAQDPDSADSQFYISLGTLPHLDHGYTVFGQVIEGMDVAKKIKIGDKMTSVRIE
ncbi:peptidylprolyl isomerase [Bdellovibrionota bacterium FG-1]